MLPCPSSTFQDWKEKKSCLESQDKKMRLFIQNITVIMLYISVETKMIDYFLNLIDWLYSFGDNGKKYELWNTGVRNYLRTKNSSLHWWLSVWLTDIQNMSWTEYKFDLQLSCIFCSKNYKYEACAEIMKINLFPRQSPCYRLTISGVELVQKCLETVSLRKYHSYADNHFV